jgi:nucleoid-associated protein YgaU
MSVATEFPPVVIIPERARRTDGAIRRAQSGTGRAHLWLVPVADPPNPLPSPAATPARLAESVPLSSVAPLRLTRRGTLALAVLVALAGAAVLFAAHLSAGGAASPTSTHSATVTVRAGDTLWSIARKVAPERDPRAVVDQLVSRNHLNGVTLTPGQTLRVA